MAIRNTFKAYERLKRGQHIDTLFHSGKAFSVFPLKLLYSFIPRDEGELSPVRVAFSVPKRKFRKAVHRNRIRRQLRDVWRLQKHSLYEHIPVHLQLHIFVIFTDVKHPEYDKLQSAITKCIDKLKKLSANA